MTTADNGAYVNPAQSAEYVAPDDWYCTDTCDHAAGIYHCEQQALVALQAIVDSPAWAALIDGKESSGESDG